MSAASGASRDWDAASYDRVSDPQLAWAREQLERLSLIGGEVVVDAGCGSGRVTALLADLVPRGRVYAVDVAPSMAEHAAAALGDRATVLCQDLVELELPEPVDALFSNATFHWIHDHDALFAALHRALKPGGQLVAQCGGRGNIDAFRTLADEIAILALTRFVDGRTGAIREQFASDWRPLGPEVGPVQPLGRDRPGRRDGAQGRGVTLRRQRHAGHDIRDRDGAVHVVRDVEADGLAHLQHRRTQRTRPHRERIGFPRQDPVGDGSHARRD